MKFGLGVLLPQEIVVSFNRMAYFEYEVADITNSDIFSIRWPLVDGQGCRLCVFWEDIESTCFELVNKQVISAPRLYGPNCAFHCSLQTLVW